MVYSCAYFEEPGDSLEDAQQAKLEHICRKLLLRPGERLLDIGCVGGADNPRGAPPRGEGSRNHVERKTAASRKAQDRRGRARGAGHGGAEGLPRPGGRELFDKVSSVGMFEHVGLKNLPLYFGTVRRF